MDRADVKEYFAFGDAPYWSERVPERYAIFDEWLRSELEKAYAWGAVDMQAECNGVGYAMNPFEKNLPIN